MVGVDIAERSPELAGGFTVLSVDLETEPLPFADARRILRPGGRVVVITPSWKHTYRDVFFSEYTHVRPFTAHSLAEALTLAGFVDVRVDYFRQLPFLWRRPYLLPLVEAVRLVPAPYRPLAAAPWPPALNKLIRFSKEVTIMANARVPEA